VGKAEGEKESASGCRCGGNPYGNVGVPPLLTRHASCVMRHASCVMRHAS